MTGSEIDTAAIRALVADTWPLTPKELYALLDALDAAREELDEMRATIERVREYVDDPGNWSALNGRRALLLRLLDGEA